MIPNKESMTVEFKSDLKRYPDTEIIEAVVAFANSEGGDLFLGVEDSGRITGVHDKHKDPVAASAFIANKTMPPVPVRAEILDEAKPVLRISVPKSESGVVATVGGKVLHRRLKADGRPENVPMYPFEFPSRLSDLRLLDYSALPLHEASIEDFDPLEVERLRSLIRSYGGDKTLLELGNTELLKALQLAREVNGTLTPTVTGILLCGSEAALRKFIPTESSSFQVLEGTEVKVNEDFRLPILKSIERLFSGIQAWNPEQELEEGPYRISVPDFDRRAIREAIVNAFSHRDYSKLGRVRVAITSEGMTIASPGGFIEGVSIGNLLTAEPHGRNPMLADALKRIGLAEKTGRGIDRIFEGSLIYGKALPDYSASTGTMVSLFIPRSTPDKAMTSLIIREQQRLGRSLSIAALMVLNSLKASPNSTAHALVSGLKLPRSVIENVLLSASKAGIVESTGKGREPLYSLSAAARGGEHGDTKGTRQSRGNDTASLENVIRLAREKPFISKADVKKLLHVSDIRAYTILRTLIQDGKLVLVQKGKYAKYRYAGEQVIGS